jgi:hypothetical protein
MFGTKALTQAASDLASGLPARLTLCISPSEGAGDWMVYRQCATETEAYNLVKDIQSICGSHLERDGNFVYCLPFGSFEDIISELQGDGYDWEETG